MGGVGKVIVTNMGSACGRKRRQERYSEYAKLQYTPGMKFLAFPDKHLGTQEQCTNEDLKAFAESKGVAVNTPGSDFMMMEPAEINGPKHHPVWEFLKKHGDTPVVWNFQGTFTVQCGDDKCDVAYHRDKTFQAAHEHFDKTEL